MDSTTTALGVGQTLLTFKIWPEVVVLPLPVQWSNGYVAYPGSGQVGETSTQGSWEFGNWPNRQEAWGVVWSAI